LKNNDAQTALTSAEKAEANNPGFYQNAALRGKALGQLGRSAEAATAFETALAAAARLSFREAGTRKLVEAGAGGK
jgi:predicted RNA polymerase sigma factor